MRLVPLVVAVACAAVTAAAQQNRIDLVAPTAPDLAAFGPLPIGVRTITVTDRRRPDVLRTPEAGPVARYDRALTLEVWYPAVAPAPGGSDYRTTAIDPSIAVTLHGRAARDAEGARGGPYPLVVISHGYPGNRLLMSHLGENLASKGFVAVSIDHTDSTYADRQAFASTLYNRSPDQLFVVGEMARLGASGSGSPLAGLVDATRTGIVGYSMGGYGVVNTIGGGYSAAAVSGQGAPPQRLLAGRTTADAGYRASLDARIVAAIAIGPWGMQRGYWDAAGLAGIRTPVLFVAGSADEVSGYDQGTRAIFDGAVNADRYLLTFVNAGHNAAAPIPAPAEVLAAGDKGRAAFAHYADAVWDTVRMNNVLQHFATAWFELHLKGDRARAAYLDVAVPEGRAAVYAMDRDGRPTAPHTYWKGFQRGTAVGLRLEHALPASARAQER
jgi:predicted dienelactone hydrolase